MFMKLRLAYPQGMLKCDLSMGWLAVEVKKRWFSIAMVALIFLIRISRLVLGVHFLGDVLFGWLIGGLLLAGFAAWSKIGRWFEAFLWRKARAGDCQHSRVILLILVVNWALGPRWVMDLNGLVVLVRWRPSVWMAPLPWVAPGRIAGWFCNPPEKKGVSWQMKADGVGWCAF